MQKCYVAEALYEKAQAQFLEKKYSETLQTLHKALEISKDDKQPSLQAQIILLKAKTNLAMVQYGDTRRSCYQGIKLAKEDKQLETLADFYLVLGQVYSQQGLYQDAIQGYQDALHIIPIHGNSYTQDLLRARLHQAIGQIARETQDIGLQRQHYVKSLFIAKRLDNQLLQAKAMLGLGICFFQQQKLSMARNTLLKARQIFHEQRDLRGVAMTLLNLGKIYTRNIEYRRAVNTFRSAYAIFEEVGDPIHQACSLVELARIFLKIDMTMTHRLCQEATELLVANPSVQSKRQSEIILGRIFIVMGQYYQQVKETDLALSSLKEGLEIFERHHCHLDYQENLSIYEKLKSSKTPVKPKKSNILAFKLGMTS